MTEKKEDASETRRTQVKELPRKEKELSEAEQKKVKGGGGGEGGFPNFGKPQGSNT